jgi:hypothetical protein
MGTGVHGERPATFRLRLPSTPIEIHYSITIEQFDSAYSDILMASQNNT